MIGGGRPFAIRGCVDQDRPNWNRNRNVSREIQLVRLPEKYRPMFGI